MQALIAEIQEAQGADGVAEIFLDREARYFGAPIPILTAIEAPRNTQCEQWLLSDSVGLSTGPLLNYLRTRRLVVDPNVSMQGVLEEARYFNMTALVATLEGESGVCEAEITRSQVLSALLHSPSGTPIRLRGLNLARLQLSRLDLSRVMLEFSNLDGAKLDYADLSQASLTKATLVGADLEMAVLRNAVIVQSNLQGARLQGCDMFGVNGKEAVMTGVQLQKVPTVFWTILSC